MIPDTILRIGSQDLVPVNDCYRFVIQKVLPAKGYKFTFSVRRKIIDYLITKGVRLEVTFKEYPELSYKYNPIDWRNKGKLKKEIKNFKETPLQLYYYFVAFNWQLTKYKQPEGQEVMI